MENKINLGIRHLTDIIYYSIMKDKKITFTEYSTILYDLKYHTLSYEQATFKPEN